MVMVMVMVVRNDAILLPLLTSRNYWLLLTRLGATSQKVCSQHHVDYLQVVLAADLTLERSVYIAEERKENTNMK